MFLELFFRGIVMKPEIKQRIEQINNGIVPDGYKKTEFGVFPCDWVTDKTFGDLFSFNGGLGKSREELSENGVEYLHYGDMHRADFNLVSLEQYSKLPKYDTKVNGDESYLMQDGDVAFLDASEDLDGTSRAVLIDNPENKPFIAGLHIIYGKSKTNELSKYYKQYITRPEYVKKQFQKLASGFKVYGLNRNTISKIKYAYPADTNEQERIAEILMKWDEAIELQEKYIDCLIAKKFYSINAILSNNAKWGKYPLSTFLYERTEIQMPDTEAPLMAFVAYEGISEKGEKYDRSQLIKSNDKKYKKTYLNDFIYSSNNLDVGSIGLNSYGTAVISVVYEVFGIKNNAIPSVISEIIQLPQNMNKIISYRQGAFYGQYKIHAQDFLKVKVSVPSIEEQTTISKLLICYDKIISEHIQKKNLLIQQRKVLQQYLLNGIVRV